MSTWTEQELDKIGQAEELKIAPRRGDGTLTKPVTIWVVRVGDELYVRSWRGHSGAWFRGALARHEGYIRAGGINKDVTFVEQAEPRLNDRIDEAYRTKYKRYATYLPSMLAAEARATTIRLEPR